MRALRLMEWKTEPVVVEVEDPEPGPGQVVVKVGGAGACHSDLHIMEFEADQGVPWNLPFTLGHENAGWIHALGDGVRGLEIGQPVAVHGAWGCGTCARCRTGSENYCENPMGAPVPGGGCGLGIDGGMAELLLVDHFRHVVPLPDGLDPVQAAPLTDAGLTPYHAVRRSIPKLGPTSTVAVIGVGGLGHLAIQIVKAITAAQVVAVDTRDEALDLATRCGADHTVRAGDLAAFEVRAHAKDRGADLVVDFVGSDATLQMAVASARAGGDLTIVGIAGGTLPFNFFAVPYELSIQSVYWGSREELVEVLELGARGVIHPTITTFSLDQAMDAYHRMHEGTLEGRAVIVPKQD